MKRITALICSILLLVGLCACGKTTGKTVLDVAGKEASETAGGSTPSPAEDGQSDSPQDPDEKDTSVQIPVIEPGMEKDEAPSDDEGERVPLEAFMPVKLAPEALPYELDLDGDGIPERIALRIMDFGELTNCYRLILTAADRQLEADTFIRSKAVLWFSDLEGDGEVEFFLCGDFASDDCITYGFRFRDGELQPIEFDDETLWPSQDAQRRYTYGEISAIDDGRLTLVETFDVLGSYRAQLSFVPTEDGYAPAEDRVDFVGNETALTVKTQIPCFDETTAKQETLAVGQTLVITGMDISRERVYFQTSEGMSGSFTLSSPDGGLSCEIGGISEFACFESLPYAG